MLEGKYKFNIYSVENVLRHFLPQINVFEHIKFTFINLCCRHKEKVPFLVFQIMKTFPLYKVSCFMLRAGYFSLRQD